MIYEFESIDGKERVELDFIIGRAPPIGKSITYHGKKYTRVPSVPAPPKVQKDCHFVSHSLPRGYKNHAGSFNEKGQPVFDSWHTQRETAARAKEEGVIYD